MRGITISAIFGLCAAAALPSAAFSEEKTADNPNGCKVVERKGGEPSGSNSITSSVTAGGGHVSGFTSAGGNGVTLHSGNGGGSSVATATTSDGHGSTIVTTSNGDCIMYVDPGKTKEH